MQRIHKVRRVTTFFYTHEEQSIATVEIMECIKCLFCWSSTNCIVIKLQVKFYNKSLLRKVQIITDLNITLLHKILTFFKILQE